MTYTKSETRKQEILDCAKRLFAERGFENAQIADICDELHIARGTVYRYFDNKEDLFITLIHEYVNSMQEALSEETVQAALRMGQELTTERMRGMLVENTHAFLLHMYRDRDIGRIILLEGFMRIPAAAELMSSFFEKRKQRLVMGLQLAMSRGLIRKCDPQLIATAMIGANSRVVLDFILQGSIKNESRLRPIAEQLVDLHLHGVLPNNQTE